MLEPNPSERGARQTRALLACGILAGPIYIAATAIQALTRDGFDPRQHRYNVLTTGDLGWIHRTNYIVAGVLMLLFAVGVARLLGQGRTGRWAPRLLAFYGVAYVSSGVFPADPVIGFPPGTLSQPTSWHATVQMASRSLSSVALVAASLILGKWFTAQGLRGWAWFSGAAVPGALLAWALVGLAGADTPTKYLAFLVPGISMWIWISALGMHLSRRTRRQDVAPGNPSDPSAAESSPAVRRSKLAAETA